MKVALPFALSGADTRDIVLDIVYYLPARTRREAIYVLDLAQNTQDEDVRKACAGALKRSQPKDEAWATLEKAKTSSVVVIREAVEERLRRRQEERDGVKLDVW